MIDKTLNYIILYGVPIIIDFVDLIAVQKRLSPVILEPEGDYSVWRTLDNCQPCNVILSLSHLTFSLFENTLNSNRVSRSDNQVHGPVGFYTPIWALILQSPSVVIHPSSIGTVYETPSPYKVELRSLYTNVIVEKTPKRVTDYQLQPILNLINEKYV